MTKDTILVGFVGLGTMGGKMAANLQTAGYKLVVHDIHRQAASPHLNAGAIWAGSPRALAVQVDVIFTSLPEPHDVEAVALGPEGLLAGMKPDAAYFDLSTNSPLVVRRLADAFAAKNAHMLDAPVSGGPAGATRRKLAIWVGGDESVFQKHKAVLDAIGDRAAYIGPIGSAAVAKLVHNLSGYAVVCALAETFTMGVKPGVDPPHSVASGAAGRRREAPHLRRAARPILAGQIRSARLHAQARTQGRFACDRPWPRARCADAHVQSRARRDDRSAQPRLGGTGLALGHAAPAGTRGGSDRSRSRALETGCRSRQVSLIVAPKIASKAAQAMAGIRAVSRYRRRPSAIERTR
jgi:3-hydroxyisobutyrate dehydrogenase-like beta-hydroxyacid dehydrogenase